MRLRRRGKRPDFIRTCQVSSFPNWRFSFILPTRNALKISKIYWNKPHKWIPHLERFPMIYNTSIFGQKITLGWINLFYASHHLNFWISSIVWTLHLTLIFLHFSPDALPCGSLWFVSRFHYSPPRMIPHHPPLVGHVIATYSPLVSHINAISLGPASWTTTRLATSSILGSWWLTSEHLCFATWQPPLIFCKLVRSLPRPFPYMLGH